MLDIIGGMAFTNYPLPAVPAHLAGQSADARLAAIASRQHGAFHRQQALAVGMTRSMLRTRSANGRFEARTRDVFAVAGAPMAIEHRLWIARLEAGPRAVVSHRAAAAAHLVPGFGPGFIDITRLRTGKRALRTGRFHETTLLPDSHTTWVGGLPVTTLPRTLFDLAAWSSPRRHLHNWPVVRLGQVARAVDDAERELGMNLDSLDRVLEDLAGRGRPGTQIIRMLLDERSDGYHATDSELEDKVLALLRRHKIVEPELQVTLGDELPIGRVDFFFRTAKVVLEADSRKYHLRMLTHDADIERDQRLAALGLLPVRVTWRQTIEDPAGFIGRLKAILGARTPECAVEAVGYSPL